MRGLPVRRDTASSTASSSARSLLLQQQPSPRGPPSAGVPGNSGLGAMQTPLQSTSSLAEKYSLGPVPEAWGVSLNTKEDDDYLHDPRRMEGTGSFLNLRSLTNLGCLILLVLGCLALFAGYPIASHFLEKKQTNQGGFNLGGINASGQIPDFTAHVGLIDPDTPKSVYTIPSYANPSKEMILVFSDEFNQDGRTFYPGDDAYWEAMDLHYWGTNDLEWYDPMQATTGNGSLLLRIDKFPTYKTTTTCNIDLEWNKFCFTGGILEASISLPGSNSVSGLWPAVWSMGNLGRAGYGATLDGVWPYSYDTCDVGTLPNQTYPLTSTDGVRTPLAATQGGDPRYDGELSFLPGQKLSRCTCRGESHPGPIHADGTYVGRAAPEIDVIEAIVTDGVGMGSFSAQFGPYNARYRYNQSTDFSIYHDGGNTQPNSFRGGVFQQTASGLATLNQDCYEFSKGCFAVYAFEYKTGFDDGYITWVNGGELSWTLRGPAMGPDTATEIGTRPISQEPMYIIANLGLSLGFGEVDFLNLVFPAVMKVDYIRVYQDPDAINIGCDPKDFPTAAYINTYSTAYSNPNLTTWVDDFKQPWPKNSRVDNC
ncbi:glycoside hydrolase family 16 protein [Hebeloma cylindrosporum]|uniref:Glycoside hydrolase family 16 protein n=1 Tax=Hebeloma cylindrosporum TaxID=76867 RepID=A0A0C3CCM9_HEBCY|nr:glycoside hydrolase family 16 protein [Hebeloma cylindrosporum h7]